MGDIIKTMIRFKRLPENILSRIEGLKGHLEDHPEVIFAYLFGGIARHPISPLSDVDIAVYVKDPKRFDYLRFYSYLTDCLGTEEVDLVILNKAPISLAGRVLQSRRLLVDKDPFLRHRYESLTIRKFLDFQRLERQYFEWRFQSG